jgi:putative DNA primase/helicase
VDLDGCIDPETGQIGEVASEIIHTMGTYTELSCFMRGTHSIGVGTKPIWAGSRSKKMGPEVEVYDRSRFMVMTGKCISGKRDPEMRQDALEWLCQRLWIKAERLHTRPPVESVARDMEDDALLDRARKARTGARFKKLFDEGDTSGFTSPSEADFTLLNMLIFWTAGDPERVVRLFETSALYRRPGTARREPVMWSATQGRRWPPTKEPSTIHAM